MRGQSLRPKASELLKVSQDALRTADLLKPMLRSPFYVLDERGDAVPTNGRAVGQLRGAVVNCGPGGNVKATGTVLPWGKARP